MTERIADCAITVIARDGLDALSIRRVAAEAGVAIGTIQYHYPTRAELVLAALQRTAQRQQVRATAVRRRPSVIATLVARLTLLLPHDEPSRQEAVVWVALAAAAARDPLVGHDQHRIVARTIESITALLDRAAQTGELPASFDTRDLAERIHVVVEGYLLQTAASATTTTPRLEQQLQTTLTTLLTSTPDTAEDAS